nr:DUF5068 domain-containing protein [Amphibacillus sediminis]
MEGVKVSLDAYTLIELNDFHTDYSIPFNDMTDGGVLIASYSVTNELDEDIYYMPDFYLSFTGADKHYNNYRNLLPLEEQLPGKLTPDTDYLVEAGQTVSGYYTYPFGEDVLATVLDLGTVSIDVPAPFAKADDFGSEFGSKGNFALSLSAAGAERVEANQAFYNDKVTADNMGNKEMIKEQTEIGESEQLGDVTVTFEGYQFTEFTPTEVEAPRFENFTNGIVLLTAKFELDNQSSDAIRLTSMSSKLTVNDGTQYILSENMLLNYSYSELISAGNSGELLQIFVLDQEQYEKIWKDKAFEIEVGPIINEDAEDISKGHKALFEL